MSMVCHVFFVLVLSSLLQLNPLGCPVMVLPSGCVGMLFLLFLCMSIWQGICPFMIDETLPPFQSGMCGGNFYFVCISKR